MTGTDDELDDNTDPGAELPASIDTDVDAFHEKLRVAGAGEPFAIDIAIRAVTLRRVDLERAESESFGDWIRGAVDEKLSHVGITDIPKGDEPPRTRPKGYTPDDDMPEEQLIAAVSQADPGDWIPVTVELPAGVLNTVARNCGEHQPVADWIRSAVQMRFAAANQEARIQPTVRVDVPPAVAQRARLWAEYQVVKSPDGDYHDALLDALLALVEPQTEYLVDGEPIASFADDDVAAIRAALESVGSTEVFEDHD